MSLIRDACRVHLRRRIGERTPALPACPSAASIADHAYLFFGDPFHEVFARSVVDVTQAECNQRWSVCSRRWLYTNDDAGKREPRSLAEIEREFDSMADGRRMACEVRDATGAHILCLEHVEANPRSRVSHYGHCQVTRHPHPSAPFDARGRLRGHGAAAPFFEVVSLVAFAARFVTKESNARRHEGNKQENEHENDAAASAFLQGLEECPAYPLERFGFALGTALVRRDNSQHKIPANPNGAALQKIKDLWRREGGCGMVESA